MTSEESAAMAKARTAGQQTPSIVRQAFLAGAREVAGLTLQPLSLGILWLLEEVGHPLVKPSEAPAESALAMRDLIAALFIFSRPREARAAIQQGRDEFDLQAGELADTLPQRELAAISTTLNQLIAEGLGTAPVDPGNPPSAPAA